MARLDQEHERAAKKAGLPIKLYRAWLADRTAFKRDKITVSEKELTELYRAVAANKQVIVRKYLQLFDGAKGAQRAFEAEANILARYGYAPTSQGFAANNVLTGIAVGNGEMVVSYVHQVGSKPPVR